MSSPYVTLGNRPLEQWRVTELREELKKRKLPTKGLKEDLLKRLDEAVRSEDENAIENEDDDALQSESPPEKKSEPFDSEDVKDSTKPELEIDDDKGPAGEAIAIEKDGAGYEGKEAKTNVIGEAVSGSHSDIEDKTMDGYSTPVSRNDELPPLHEDAKIEQPDTIIQLPHTNESTTAMASHSEPNLQGSKTQDESVQPIVEDVKSLQQDSSVQTLEYQVSEVKPDLGFQVTSDSVSTESVSIIEKNELKVDVITDNVQLELDIKDEMVQPPASNAVPDGGDFHPIGVEEPLAKKDEIDDKEDVEEPLGIKHGTVDKKDIEEPLEKSLSTDAISGSNMENIDSLKNNDSIDLGPPEKLSLDRSSGDDSMEEDIIDSKQMEYKSDTNKSSDNVESSRKAVADEEDHVDVVGQDKPVEMKVDNAANETVLGQAYMKRKFHDKAAGSNDTVKKTRRLNVEGLKVTQSVDVAASIAPRAVSGPTLKRSGTDPAANVETPKERIVPPSAKPATNSLRIDRFLRPFTLKAVQELLGKTGTVTSFWMDHIKTHCYVSYSSVEEAVETRNAVYNLQWPPNGGRMLAAEFVDSQEVKTRLQAPPATPSGAAPNFPTNQTQQHTVPTQPSPRQQVLRQPLPPPPHVREHPPHPSREPLPREQPPLTARDRINLPPPPPLPEKNDPPIVTLDDLFRKTKATPRIYYLPLSDEQVATKLNVNQ